MARQVSLYLAMEVAGGGFAPSAFNLLYLFRPLNLNLITTYGAMDDSTAESFSSSN
jgi:hypothetical protein